MEVIRTAFELRSKFNLNKNKTIGFVPTMGALHEGHGSLITAAKKENDLVVVSIFVNPTQFNNPNDLSKYPRPVESDLKFLELHNVDYLFFPEPNEIYPNGYRTSIHSIEWEKEKILCDKFRPGHFQGVLTVVNILFNIVKPTRAYFGLKDAQQCAYITNMVSDLQMEIQIVPCETIRDSEDNVALSSRNKLLSSEDRKTAKIIPEVLFKISKGDLSIDEGKKKLKDSKIEVEYLEIRSFPDLKLENNYKKDNRDGGGGSRIFFAGFLGSVRLIDNMEMGLQNASWRK